MKLKELPPGTNLTKIKVKLDDSTLQLYKDYAGGEREMWIAGGMMGDFFLSPNGPEEKQRRLYPLPVELEPSFLLECEVVENKN